MKTISQWLRNIELDLRDRWPDYDGKFGLFNKTLIFFGFIVPSLVILLNGKDGPWLMLICSLAVLLWFAYFAGNHRVHAVMHNLPIDPRKARRQAMGFFMGIAPWLVAVWFMSRFSSLGGDNWQTAALLALAFGVSFFGIHLDTSESD